MVPLPRERGRRRVWLLLLALFGSPALAEEHDHAHTPAPAAAPAPAGPALYTADDLAFLHHMVVHHQQALDMAALMAGRTEREEFIRFAGYVADAQRAEIAAMQGMLDMAAARGLPAPAHLEHADPPMAGMLSSAEMKALAEAKGAAFERLWLTGMMFHHEGGLAMARAQELRQAMEGRQPYGLATMLDDILVNQRAEITRMREWLQEWGLAAPGDSRPPAVEVAGPATAKARTSVTVLGVAVDDTGVTAVEVAIHDMARDRWLQGNGGWGPTRQKSAAERIGSGPASAAWRLAFTPPAPGEYHVLAEAVDGAGNRTPAPAHRTLVAR